MGLMEINYKNLCATLHRQNYEKRKRIEQLEDEKKRWAKQILKARDALIKEDYEDAYHQLYGLASPEFDKFNPWQEIEALKDKP